MSIVNRVFMHPDKLLVRRDKPETHTEAGLEIPKAAQRTTNTGSVIVSGTDADAFWGGFPSGCKVAFPVYTGVDVEIEDEEFIVLDKQHILFVLDNKEGCSE